MPDSIPSGGSWLGGKVLSLSDGTFIFDDELGSTTSIKTQATPGDTWTFYHDTTTRYYIATVLSIDTMTILGAIDSIKNILINAYDTGGIVTTDPVNGYKIILSKNNGFYQIFDLYTFPYHSTPDYFYELCGSQIFNLVDFYDPPLTVVNDFAPGDIYEKLFQDQAEPLTMTSEGYIIDSIISKTLIDSSEVSYTINEKQYTHYFTYPPSETLTQTIFSESFFTTPLYDTSIMPEDGADDIYYYYPGNDTLCRVGNSYTDISGILFNTFEPCGTSQSYQIGIGSTEQGICYDPSGIGHSQYLVYSYKNGVACGTYTPITLGVTNLQLTADIMLFPDPATNNLTITSSEKITKVIITNYLGQVVHSEEFNADKVNINVTALSAGVYLVKINNSVQKKFVKY